MKSKPKKIPFVITAMVFIISAFAAVLPKSGTPPKFKNLKVLPKNISETELDKIMDEYCYALDVHCDFCHRKDVKTKELDFPSDSKGTKEITRNMMRMTNELNKKYFNFNNAKVVPQTVTCITCHRKNTIPQTDSLPSGK